MIKLTRIDGREVYLSPDIITAVMAINPNRSGINACVITRPHAEQYEVKELPDDIANRCKPVVAELGTAFPDIATIAAMILPTIPLGFTADKRMDQAIAAARELVKKCSE